MPQVARCLWGGGFTSTLTIAGDLRNTPRTSPISAGFLSMTGEAGVVAPKILSIACKCSPRRHRRIPTGEAGVVAPKILSAVLADPDNRDVVFSDGDTLTITFDSETNRAISRVEGYDDEKLA
jgi:hypothetical protein